MIVTVTPNTAFDYTLSIHSFELNQTIRAEHCAWGMGGKAADAAWILGKLGEPVLALGFAGGFNGKRMESMLHEHGVSTDFVWVDGETRLNVVITTKGGGQSTITAPGLQVSPVHLVEFDERYQKAIESASCVILGGSLPPGVSESFYFDTISKARERSIPVIFDTSGPAILEGLKARPTIVKPNLDELSTLVGHPLSTFPEIKSVVLGICDEHKIDMVLTLGNEGSLVCLRGQLLRVEALQVGVASSAGAGDGVLAGLALAIAQHETMEKGLVYGFALAGAIVQTLPTADFRLEDYNQLLDKIEIIPL